MTLDQIRFLRLHHVKADDFVTSWRRLFGESTVLAATSKGRKAAIRRDEADALVAGGYMLNDWGGYYLTPAGRAV